MNPFGNRSNIIGNLFRNELNQIPEMQSEFSDSSPLVIKKKLENPGKIMNEKKPKDCKNETAQTLESSNPTKIGGKIFGKENVNQVFKPKVCIKSSLRTRPRPEKSGFFTAKSLEMKPNETLFDKHVSKVKPATKKSPDHNEIKERSLYFMSLQGWKKTTPAKSTNSFDRTKITEKSESFKQSFSKDGEINQKRLQFSEIKKTPSFFKEVKQKSLLSVLERRCEKEDSSKKPFIMKKDSLFFEKLYQTFKQQQKLESEREKDRQKAYFTKKELKQCTLKPRIQRSSISAQPRYLTFPVKKHRESNTYNINFEQEKVRCAFSPKRNLPHRSVSPIFQVGKKEGKIVERMRKVPLEKKNEKEIDQEMK